MKVPQSLRDIVDGSESLVYVEDLSNKRGLMQSINPLINLIVVVFMIVTSLFIFSLPYLALICIIPFILALASTSSLKISSFQNHLDSSICSINLHTHPFHNAWTNNCRCKL